MTSLNYTTYSKQQLLTVHMDLFFLDSHNQPEHILGKFSALTLYKLSSKKAKSISICTIKMIRLIEAFSINH